ncbi:Cof-type HAD-IIB family hydrolase [bacterium]|nr:Cof-type HAD-IIB family hydrolase [bacterium]
MKVVISDLDGTLLNNKHELSPRNRSTLEKLKSLNILRVIATGRSIYSFRKALPDSFPVDYVIFSSGAGIMDWKKKEIIRKKHLSSDKLQVLITMLKSNKYDFMIHHEIPENHRFYYHQTERCNPDFKRRLDIYSEFSISFQKIDNQFHKKEFCQIVAIEPQGTSVTRYDAVKSAFPDHTVIRVTSPLDNKSFWIEIFPGSVSKRKASEYLLDVLGISSDQVMSIGNDYNDLDLLNWTTHSFIVKNAPEEIKSSFTKVASNEEDGFSEAVEMFMQF